MRPRFPCLYFAVVTWFVHLRGPEQPGWTAVPSGKSVLVEAVRPASAAARAGVAVGDRIIEWDGRSPFGFIRLCVIHAEIGRPYKLMVERAGVSLRLLLSFQGKDRSFWRTRDGLRQIAQLLGAALYVLLGLGLAFARPRDSSALWGATSLCGIGIGIMHLSSFAATAGAFGLVRRLPGPLGISFLAIFPRRLFHGRAIWAAVWLPTVARIAILMYWWIFLTYTPEAFHGFGWTADTGDDALLPFLLCAIAILIWNVTTLGLRRLGEASACSDDRTRDHAGGSPARNGVRRLILTGDSPVDTVIRGIPGFSIFGSCYGRAYATLLRGDFCSRSRR